MQHLCVLGVFRLKCKWKTVIDFLCWLLCSVCMVFVARKCCVWTSDKRFAVAPFWSMNYSVIVCMRNTNGQRDKSTLVFFSFTQSGQPCVLRVAGKWSYANKQLTGLPFSFFFYFSTQFSIFSIYVFQLCHCVRVNVVRFSSLHFIIEAAICLAAFFTPTQCYDNKHVTFVEYICETVLRICSDMLNLHNSSTIFRMF